MNNITFEQLENIVNKILPLTFSGKKNDIFIWQDERLNISFTSKLLWDITLTFEHNNSYFVTVNGSMKYVDNLDDFLAGLWV